MRLSLILLAAATFGWLGGAWLCGIVVFGAALMTAAAGVGAYALLRDDGKAAVVPEVDVLERLRRVS